MSLASVPGRFGGSHSAGGSHALAPEAARSSRRSAALPEIDWTGWRKFAIAMLALAFAMALALYSSSAAETGRLGLAASAAIAALSVAAWVAFTIVPVLARRTSLNWFQYRTEYRVTREGAIYLLGIFVVALAALNTGNNLLFMVLACLISGILVSGVISQIVLRDVELRLDLPEHIFAGQPVSALAELVNRKQRLPSFSLRLVGVSPKSTRASARGENGGRKWTGRKKHLAQQTQAQSANEVLRVPVYFPYVRPQHAVQQAVQLVFPRRGIYRQEALGLQTRFPFGFLKKTRVVNSKLQAVVYPSVLPTEDFYELLPLASGEIESFLRGRGNDLYSIRDYQTTDTARYVDWKASAKSGVLQVREFAREDERRVLLVFDPSFSAALSGSKPRRPIFNPDPEIETAAKHRVVTGRLEADGLASKVADGVMAASPDPDLAADSAALCGTPIDRGVDLCASLAWHFYNLDSMLMFRSVGIETRMAPASELIYDILGHLATADTVSTEIGQSLLNEVSESSQVFKIVLTAQPRGSISQTLWNSSYVIFMDS